MADNSNDAAGRLNAQQQTLRDVLRPRFDALAPVVIKTVLVELPKGSGNVAASVAKRQLRPELYTFHSSGVYGQHACKSEYLQRPWRTLFSPVLPPYGLPDREKSRFYDLARDAGNCIGPWAEPFGIPADTINDHDASKWHYVLFDLAWSHAKQFPMRAGKCPIFTSKSHHAVGFWSKLPNVVLASVYAIDVLTSEPTEARTTPATDGNQRPEKKTEAISSRAELWASWHDNFPADERNKYGKIRDKWNDWPATQRTNYEPIGAGKAGYDVVRKAIKNHNAKRRKS